MTIGEYYKFPEGFEPKLLYIPHWYELNPTIPCPEDSSYLFENWGGLSVPSLDVSNVTTMANMYNGCSKLKYADLKSWDCSKCTNMSSMFMYDGSLEKFDLTGVDTSKVTTFYNMLYYCGNLQMLGSIDCSGVNTKNYYPIGHYSNLSKLTEIGGFLGMKMSWDSTDGLAKCPNLTYESCINILNGLYDFVGNNEEVGTNQGVLKVHSNFLTLVGDEISIGTNKGWTITA